MSSLWRTGDDPPTLAEMSAKNTSSLPFNFYLISRCLDDLNNELEILTPFSLIQVEQEEQVINLFSAIPQNSFFSDHF